MALEGSPADVAPGSAGASVSSAILRDAIKDSLLEVLRENPSLLRPPPRTPGGPAVRTRESGSACVGWFSSYLLSRSESG